MAQEAIAPEVAYAAAAKVLILTVLGESCPGCQRIMPIHTDHSSGLCSPLCLLDLCARSSAALAGHHLLPRQVSSCLRIACFCGVYV